MIVVAGGEEPTMAIAYPQIEAARNFITNADLAAKAAEAAHLPFWLFLAVLQKESGGKNVYGNDAGGALAGYPREVDESNWLVFWWLVSVKGQTSNGVGPCQITFPGFFKEMLAADLKPWDPADNMLKGAQILRQYLTDAPRTMTTEQRIKLVGSRYNGSSAYGADLWRVALVWHGRVGHSDNRSFRP